MQVFGAVISSLAIILFAHLIACLWYFVGSSHQDPDSAAGYPGLLGWVEREWGVPCGDVEIDLTPQIVNATDICYSGSMGTRYITAIYWSMMTISTVGYGDIGAVTSWERVAASLAMLFGALIFAAITGSMAAKITATKGAEAALNTKMDEVRQYLADSNVNISTRRQVEAHFNLLWSGHLIYNEAEILALLPRGLRDNIVDSLYSTAVRNVTLFHKLHGSGLERLEKEVLGRLAQRLKNTVANFGQVVIQEGEIGDEMFLIHLGEVDVFRSTISMPRDEAGNPDFHASLGARLGRLGATAFFGECAVMEPAPTTSGLVLDNSIRVRSVVARCACNFLVLSKAALDELRHELPILHNTILTIESAGSSKSPFNLAELASPNARQPRLSRLGAEDAAEVGASAEAVAAVSNKVDRLQEEMRAMKDMLTTLVSKSS